MNTIRSISGPSFDPYCDRDPLGLNKAERTELPGTPEYEGKLRAVETLWQLRAATKSTLIHDWADTEEISVRGGNELNLEALYYDLQANNPELSAELENEVEAYRQVVSDMTTLVRSTAAAKKKSDDVGFGDEDELLSA